MPRERRSPLANPATILSSTTRRAVSPASGKILNVPVPGLQPGCTIELVYTRRDLVSPEQFPYTEHYFTAEVPILSETYYVRASAAEIVSRTSAGVVGTVR